MSCDINAINLIETHCFTKAFSRDIPFEITVNQSLVSIYYNIIIRNSNEILYFIVFITIYMENT